MLTNPHRVRCATCGLDETRPTAAAADRLAAAHQRSTDEPHEVGYGRVKRRDTATGTVSGR